ncbi:MAG: cell division protein ZipA [Gammaproteobacteria bacterium]|nr:cell division protein ZipA [Gammaproteobacteria bacterium]
MVIELRIGLIVAGLAVLVMLYYFTRAKKRKTRRKEFEDFDFDKDDLLNPLDADLGSEIESVGPVRVIQQNPDYPGDRVEMPDSEESTASQDEQTGEEGASEEKKLVVLHVMARRPEAFKGTGIMDLVRELDLEYDDMRIFHKKVKRLSGRKAMYSILNAVKPGTFDLDNMDQFETPGISFVMSLPGPENGLKAFNIMHEAAKRASEYLQGEIFDESRNRLSQQTVAHLQEEVQLFSLKHPGQDQDT